MARSKSKAKKSADEDAMSFSDHDKSDYESRELAPSQDESDDPIDKDSDEEALERLVLGDSENFRQRLLNGDDLEDVKSDFEGFGDEDNEDDESNIEDLDDTQLFFLDAPTATAGKKQIAELPKAPATTEAAKNAPAWEDSDDAQLVVSIAQVGMLRKLRTTEADDFVSGTEYTRLLRQHFLRDNPTPDWAKISDERPAKRRRRSSAASGSDVSDVSASDDDEPSALPLKEFLRDVKSTKEGASAKRKKLRPEVIDIQRSRDIADRHKDAVTSLSFHPEYPVLLSASTSTVLFLHHVAPTAYPTPNPLLTSVQVKQVPVRHAEFLVPPGDTERTKIFFAGRRRFLHTWDLASGIVQKTGRIQGHHLEQRTWERFKLSPCGRYLGLIASTKKGGGIVNILNVSSMQWIAAARLDSRGGIAEFQWWSNGNGMTILGKGGQVGEWSMVSKRFIGVWKDEGSIGGTVLALGGRKGSELLGGDRYVAIGSNSGIVNIYDRMELIIPSEDSDDDEVLELKNNPKPLRTFEQLTIPITFTIFSPDGEILAFGSRHKKDALRLAHVSSCTVFRNWPTDQTPLGRVTSIAFGGKSDLLAVGNDAGKIRLWEIRR